MKIAIYLASLRGGGVERVMINLARGFVERGLSVDLVLANACGPLLAQVPEGIRVIDLKSRRVMTSLPGLVRYLKLATPDAMLAAMAHVNIIAIWAVRLAGVKTRLVISVHSMADETNKNLSRLQATLMYLLMYCFYPLANSVIVVSRAAKSALTKNTFGNVNKDIRVIYNPVVTPELYQKAKLPVAHRWFDKKQPPVILAVGRLDKVKDFESLIMAFSIVRKKISAKLLILGDGEERERLQRLVENLGLANDIELHRYVDNPYQFMAHSAVLVSSSVWEGLPTVLIEALALHLPIVAYNCPGGTKEILKNGKCGTLVKSGDHVALANAILITLTKHPLPQPACADVDLFHVDNVTSEYLAVLRGNQDG